MKQRNSSSLSRTALKSLAAMALLAIGCPTAIYANGYPQPSAQTAAAITGTVVDETGEPLIGASVRVKDRKESVTTDINGNFRINASAGQPLEFAYVGYKPVTMAAAAGMTVTLAENSQVLGEVVVLGYNTVKKSDLTGSVSSMANADLIRGGLTNAAGSMQGKIPGVTIQKANNKPGGDYNILIRGLNTISGSTAPLVVVDGVPGASLANINPDDIEQIDILKDASSTAIYGSRATNGVVIVTTKRGKEGKPQISYSGYAGFRQYMNIPEFMSGAEYVQLAREAARASNKNNYKDDANIFTASELAAIADGNYFDWVDAGSKNAFTTNHTIQANGGNNYVTYALSGGVAYDDGLVKPQTYTRYNIRSAVDVHLSEKFSFGINLYGTHTVRDTGNSDVLQDLLRMRPTYHPYDLVSGEECWAYSNGQYNPLIAMKNEYNKTKQYNLLGNIYLSLTPVKGLTLKTMFSPNITINEIGQYRGKYTKANKGQNEATSNYAKNSYVNWVWDNVANYSLNLQDMHRIELTGVFSMLQNQYERLYGQGNGLSFNSLWFNLQGGSAKNASQSDFTKSNLMSYLGRVQYTFNDRYILTASIRFDGSSKLADGHKWASFPSVAVAWRASNEAFLRDLQWLNNLKLRVSYGQTGNDNTSPYGTAGSIGGAQYYTFGNSDVIGYLPNNLRNLDLGWERTKEWNFGIDYGFLNGRISGSIDYYRRTTSDLIMNKTVPITTGYPSVKANVGTVRNEGFEFSISTENIHTSDFSWHTTFSLSYNKNQIVDLQYKEDLSSRGKALEGMVGDYSNLWVIGQPIDINYNLVKTGVWQLDEAEEAAKYGCKPGQYKFLDVNGDGAYTDADRQIDGKRTPDWIGGMTNTLSYRDFDLAFAMNFQTGARMRNQFFVSYASEGNALNFNNLRRDYWTPENPTNAYAQPSNQGSYAGKAGPWGNAKSETTLRYTSTDYLKVGYITLGYTLPQRWVGKVGITKLRLYATVQNPFIWCDEFVFDPEQTNTSINTTDFMTRNWLFGLNVSF